MKKRYSYGLVATLAIVILGSLTVAAQDRSVVVAGGQALQDRLSQTLAAASQNQLQVANIRNTEMADLLEVELSSGELLYTNPAGDFLLTGDLLRTTESGVVNLTAQTRGRKVVEMIADVPESEMIIFRPQEVKGSLTVFTDADCTFCRKLHGDIEEIMARGIEVRYLAYPRGGAASAVFPKMISVWCAEDRNRALTQAKHGQNLPKRECDNPVQRHYELGNRVGITGTPALVLDDGTVVPGYVDVDRLTSMVLQ